MYNELKAIDNIVSDIKGITNLISKTLFNKNYIIILTVMIAVLISFLSFN